MTHYAFGNQIPTLGEQAWVAPSAELVGDVRLGARTNIWFGAIIRADNTPILIGEDSNIQDGAIGHSDVDAPLIVGARVTVGHQAILHGCTIEDDVLIGLGAKVLNGAVIASDCLVGAGALVTEGKRFEPGWLIIGSPAKAVRPLTDAEKAGIRHSAHHYVERAAEFAARLEAL
ncbi:MAG: gamma carbonic anhydrase family protein [Sphingomonas sp.]|nr:gamma carbonic anhydrase family protein [Sphingomonas sp.]